MFYELFFFASGKTLRDKKKVSFVNQEPTIFEQSSNLFNNLNNIETSAGLIPAFESQEIDSAVNSENLEMENNETHTV